MIDDNILSIIGIMAGILILSGWVEQLIKGYKTKSLKDVSKYLMILITGGAILWIIYGVEMKDPFIIGTNITAIALMMAVLFMKRKYDRKLKAERAQFKE
ncbi:MAG: hypothetical protein GWN01_09680 [Nitrosopumilaceae archaeon]|nr:hypothetical protein [Nitrosopumilaceae archaeon]NIU01175.1 hypothetical protein [Nitrosopumilaceae archaeon]NIU87544.1 hypothetical protein [Nitrosopumilaceae archaeon]NIV66009.1 hypothetical protein [Nitrosopumilaceae archaeon]NIX61777.1 hypothetical protein [Nitrosopumilaceae archaeon]